MIGNFPPFNVEHASFSKSLNYQQQDGHKTNIMSNHINRKNEVGQLQP